MTETRHDQHGRYPKATSVADFERNLARVHERMAAACRRVTGLFDSSKFGGFGLHSFAPVGRFQALTRKNPMTRTSLCRVPVGENQSVEPAAAFAHVLRVKPKSNQPTRPFGAWRSRYRRLFRLIAM